MFLCDFEKNMIIKIFNMNNIINFNFENQNIYIYYQVCIVQLNVT